MSPEKNLQMAIKALPHVVSEDKDVLLVVKGRTVDRKYLGFILKLIKKLNVSKYVRFDFKWSPNVTMVYYYYRAADVYVHTSLSEAFGSLTLLEAMASGTPVVANNASSIPEAVGNAGLLVNSEEELAEKILEILHDDSLRRKLSREGFRRVIENFSLKITAKKYLQLYRKLMG
ncbi:glycosyltransferase family 4 protein [Pyrodictium occultum]|uniref:glycosyltransferase family 4 protein n=1 Tax=Pyrodictium occultum TaxID=2309 RepID=UPI0022A8F4BE|nr:glycosyltransferase family 4 protein [Pyrodictium occultum]